MTKTLGAVLTLCAITALLAGLVAWSFTGVWQLAPTGAAVFIVLQLAAGIVDPDKTEATE